MKNKKGFTLIELLAVIIILGILMIIAIPSVTSYINNSRKSAYVSTAKEIVSGARTFVNEGKLEMFDTGATYYIPVSCISTENGQKSPYGDFVENQAFVIVTYTGSNYNYYWISRDTTGQGVKTITPVGEFDEDDIVSDISASEITPTEPASSDRTTIKVLSKEDCKTFGEGSITPTGPTAAEVILSTAQENGQLTVVDEENEVYIFKGANPANYVKFNNETWRIIGIYGNQLKIINTESIGRKAYNDSTSDNSWEESKLKEYLNNTYINDIENDYMNLVSVGSWYVGSASINETASESYNSLKNSSRWNGKIGLVNAFEYLYASKESCYDKTGANYKDACSDNNWLNMNKTTDSWTISPSIHNSTRAISIEYMGVLNSYYTVLRDREIYPAVILKSSVKIVDDGKTGTSTSDAYNLTLN